MGLAFHNAYYNSSNEPEVSQARSDDHSSCKAPKLYHYSSDMLLNCIAKGPQLSSYETTVGFLRLLLFRDIPRAVTGLIFFGEGA